MGLAATVLRVLLAHGRQLPYRAPREKSPKRPWPDWVDYRPLQVWGYDFSEFPAAGTSALAILDLVSRTWIDTLICPEATHVQVQALFTRALEREGLLDRILSLLDELGPGADPSDLQPVLLSVSDNGAQMTSGSTREFMALHAIATHYGRPGTPTDQAHIESLLGHLKHEWPYLCALAEPADLARELEAVREQYNRVRLHAGIGYVTPDDEHEGRGPTIRHARRAGLARAREQRLASYESMDGKQSAFWTVGPDGTGLRRLTHFKPGTSVLSASYAADGKWIVYGASGVGGSADIFVMRADGTSSRPMTRTKQWDSAPDWGPPSPSKP